MGLSFGELVLRQRGARAAQLLLSSDVSLEAIADELGFVDASHLHRMFARRYGYTPARYRKMAHSLHQPGTASDPTGEPVGSP
jgi:transcriptional regulator GlxA family with amidase domain